MKGLTESLWHAGLEVHVATTDDDGASRMSRPLGTPVDEGGVTYWYFQRQTRFYTGSWPLLAWLSKHAETFDLLHVHGLFSFPSVAAAFCARWSGVPYIVRPLGTLDKWGMQNRRPWLKQLSFRLLERRILEHAAVIHYTSEQEMREATATGVSAPGEVIPNPVAHRGGPRIRGTFRAKFPQLGTRPMVLFLSRIDQKKGVPRLLNAFKDVRHRVPDAALVIAGSGDPTYCEMLKRQADALGIARDVIWAGHVHGRDKDSAFTDADVFVLPSYSENFGIAVAEAMASALPVVISNHVGIHHDVSAGGAGLVIECDAVSLSSALVTLLRDARLRKRLATNAQQLAHERYSMSAVTKRIVQTYERAFTKPLTNPVLREQPCSIRSLP